MPETRPKTPSRGSTAVLFAITGLGLVVFLGSVGLAAWALWRGEAGEVADESWLEVHLTPMLSDAPAQGGLFLDPQDVPPVLTDVTASIRKAAGDERIEGVYLVVDGGAPGFAGAQELRDALGALRAAGKPCVAYSEAWTTLGYYVGAACDRVVAPPNGVGLVTGLAVSTTYYAGMFEKWGIEADLLHVGEFKSAVEPYTRTEPSEPAAAATSAMLDSLWGRWVAGVADGRKRTAGEVQAWVDQPRMSSQGMLEAGMIDALVFPDQVRAHLTDVTAEGWVASLGEPVPEEELEELDDRFTPLSEYLKEVRAEQSPSTFGSGNKIAVVYAEGPIVSGEAGGGLFGGAAIADRTTHDWLEDIREDEEVDAVVLRVNSPGGSGQASDMIWRDLERIKASGKPVVVSMGNYAASGGYYIAAAGDWIVAEPSTLTGSIGVFGGKITFGGAYEWLGLTESTQKRGQNADLLSLTEPFTEEGRAVYQRFLDDFYEVFLSRVSDARGLSRDEVHEVAQGRVWTGEQALERKLVDELGGLEEALAKAAELAELGEEGYAVERWPKSKSFFELVMEDLEPSARIEVPLLPEELLRDVLVLDRVLDSGVAALLPGAVRLGR